MIKHNYLIENKSRHYLMSVLTRILLTLIVSLLLTNVQASSKKVQVYEKSQQYWDVARGESLSLVCLKLQKNNKAVFRNCQQKLFQENPDAFINKDPNQLISGKRLWLPGSYRPASSQDSKKYHIKNFSWGSVKTPK